MTTLPPEEQELGRFLHTLCANLGKALELNVIPLEWLCSGKGNENSMLHSRVWGVLAKTGFDLGYTVEVNAGFNASGLIKRFVPDLQLWESNHLRFLVEYESTNSSDSRIIDADLSHCYRALNAARDEDAELPDFWLVIYTLPDHQVSTWSHWDYSRRSDAFAVMSRNPHLFYRKAFETPDLLSGLYYPDRWRRKGIRAEDCHAMSDCTKEAHERQRQVFFINLTARGLQVDFPARLKRNEYPFESARSKR